MTSTLYPPKGFGAPKDRKGHALGSNVGLPSGTKVFSADNHISPTSSTNASPKT